MDFEEEQNNKWNELIGVSNAEYSILKTNEFLQKNNNKNIGYKNIGYKNKYELKVHMFYKKIYELANYFNIEWHLISDSAYEISTIYADYYTENMIINDKLVLDVLDFIHKNKFIIVSQYYITVLYICIMSS